jgi:hypothetical protein
MRNVKYKYSFEMGQDKLFLAVGETKITSENVEIKVKRYTKADGHLTIAIDGTEYNLERGEYQRHEVIITPAFPKGVILKS